MFAAALGMGLAGCNGSSGHNRRPVSKATAGERAAVAESAPLEPAGAPLTPAARIALAPHPGMRTPAPTAIYSVMATPAIVHGGQSVHWDVRTSPDVISVAAHVAAITLPLTRVAAGHFLLTFAVPNGVPFFFHGVYDLDVRAATADGTTLHRDVELTFQ